MFVHLVGVDLARPDLGVLPLQPVLGKRDFMFIVLLLWFIYYVTFFCLYMYLFYGCYLLFDCLSLGREILCTTTSRKQFPRLQRWIT